MADKLTVETLTTPKTFGAILTWLNNTFKAIVDFINDYISKIETQTENDKTVFGVYTWDGTTERTINLGFKHVAVEVYTKDGMQGNSYGVNYYCYGGLALSGYNCRPAEIPGVEICDTGFKVSLSDDIYTNNSNLPGTKFVTVDWNMVSNTTFRP